MTNLPPDWKTTLIPEGFRVRKNQPYQKDGKWYVRGRDKSNNQFRIFCFDTKTIEDKTDFNRRRAPRGWNEGFEYPISIAENGAANPFHSQGRTFIRVWNHEERRNLLYCYETDSFLPIPEKEFEEEL